MPLSWANSPTLGTFSSPRMRRADIEVPNPAVDMDSWAGSACYPRRTFYPLSDGLSMQNHRITMPCFRICSTCPSRSQAPLCACTLRLIPDQAEGTFERLRYSLGGNRPSQTAYQTLFLKWVTLQVRFPARPAWYPNDDSDTTGVAPSKSPTYPVQNEPKINIKLQ